MRLDNIKDPAVAWMAIGFYDNALQRGTESPDIFGRPVQMDTYVNWLLDQVQKAMSIYERLTYQQRSAGFAAWVVQLVEQNNAMAELMGFYGEAKTSVNDALDFAKGVVLQTPPNVGKSVPMGTIVEQLAYNDKHV